MMMHQMLSTQMISAITFPLIVFVFFGCTSPFVHAQVVKVAKTTITGDSLHSNVYYASFSSVQFSGCTTEVVLDASVAALSPSRSIEISFDKCAFDNSRLFLVANFSAQDPALSLTISFTDTYFSDAVIGFRGIFPSNTNITMDSLMVVSTMPSNWTSTSYFSDFSTVAAALNPTIGFMSSTFLPGSRVVLRNLLISSKSTMASAFVVFAGDTIFRQAYFGLEAFSLTSAMMSANSVVISLCAQLTDTFFAMDGSTVVIADGDVFEWQAGSLSTVHIALRNINFNNDSVLFIDHVTASTSNQSLVGVRNATLALGSWIGIRSCVSNGPLLIIDLALTMSSGSTMVISANKACLMDYGACLLISYSVNATAMTDATAPIYSRCNRQFSNSTEIASADELQAQLAGTTAPLYNTLCSDPATVFTDCVTRGGFNNAGPATGLDSVTLECTCDGVSGGGSRCFSYKTALPYPRFSDYAFRFHFEGSIAVNNAKFYISSAFTGIQISGPITFYDVTVRIDSCYISENLRPSQKYRMKRDAPNWQHTMSLSGVAFSTSLIAFNGCPYFIDTSLFNQPPVQYEIKNSAFTNTPLYIQGLAPTGSRYGIVNVMLESNEAQTVPTVGCSVSSASISVFPVKAAVIFCGFGLVGGSFFVMMDTAMALSSLRVDFAVQVVGGLIVSNASQFIWQSRSPQALYLPVLSVLGGTASVAVTDRSILALQYISIASTVSTAFTFDAPSLQVADNSVLMFDEIDTTYQPAGTLFHFAVNETTLSNASWLLFRKIFTMKEPFLDFFGNLHMEQDSRITIADSSSSTANLAYYLSGGFSSRNSYFSTKCLKVNSSVVSAITGNIFMMRQDHHCSQCHVDTSCFPTFAASIHNRTCQCSCLSGFGPMCLPVDPVVPITGDRSGVTLTETVQESYTYSKQVFDKDQDIIFSVNRLIFEDVIFAGSSTITFDLTELSSFSTMGAGERPKFIEFRRCKISSALLYFIGFPVGDIYNVSMAANETGEGLTADNTRISIIFDDVAITTGSTILFYGLLPPRTNISISNVAGIEDAAVFSASSFATLSKALPYYSNGKGVYSSYFRCHMCMFVDSVLALHSMYLPSTVVAVIYPIMFSYAIALNRSVISIDLVHVATISQTPLSFDCFRFDLIFASAVTVSNSNFTSVTSAAAIDLSGQGSNIYMLQYSILSLSNLQLAAGSHGVNIYYAITADKSSAVWIDHVATTTSMALINGRLDLSGLSSLVLSHTASLRLLTEFSSLIQGSTFSNVYARCVSLFSPSGVNGTFVMELLQREDFYNTSHFGSLVTTYTTVEVVPCDECRAELECMFPTTKGMNLSDCTCKCLTSPLIAASSTTCVLRGLDSYFKGTILAQQRANATIANTTAPGASCSFAAVNVQVEPSDPTYPEWFFRLRFSRPLEGVSGIFFNNRSCDLSSMYATDGYGGSLVGISGVRFDANRCAGALSDFFAPFYDPSFAAIFLDTNVTYLWSIDVEYDDTRRMPPAAIQLRGSEINGYTIPFFPPRPHSVSGCLRDSFPSTFFCPTDGSAPLTIIGEYFAPLNMSVQIDFFEAPVTDAIRASNESLINNYFDFAMFRSLVEPIRSVSCLNLTFVDETTVICSMYEGKGLFGVVSIISPYYSTPQRNPRVTVSFVPNLADLCPVSITFPNTTCSGHGVCDANLGVCLCDSSASNGFWSGPDCGQCAVRFNNSESSGCLQECPTDAFGNICSGVGECASGLCRCGSEDWSQSTCNGTCPGAEVPCSGNGYCNLGTGLCACFNDSELGYYTGAACDSCVLGYSGQSCTKRCPVSAINVTLPCSGRGDCFNGYCFCNQGYCGSACELIELVDNCGSCPLPSYYGFSCGFVCPGTANDGVTVCSGHGRCDKGTNGSGTCFCDLGFGGPSCAAQCPIDLSNGLLCSGHGQCSGETGQCECQRFYGTSDCSLVCPFVGGIACGIHGTCDEGAFGTARCLCDYGYYGEQCDSSCWNEQLPCGGHGVCQHNGTCSCFQSLEQGFWGTDLCGLCANGWAGSSCTVQCDKGLNGLPCSGRGFCNNALRCQCPQSFEEGFWGGATCSTCSFGFAGATCTTECDGGSCSPCNHHGICNPQDGSCTCFHDTINGDWNESTNCNTCVDGVYGPLCQHVCVDCQQGWCVDGTLGNGTCACDPGFTASGITGSCTECLPNRYGPSCLECPPCYHGYCNSTVTGDGTCVCDATFAGVDCSYSCNVSASDGQLCGVEGLCVGNGTCHCSENFTTVGSLDNTCSECAQGKFGVACNETCPPCDHGKCSRLNGICSCDRGYWGVACRSVCPGGAANPCSGHGACDLNTGSCTCDASPTTGYFSGTACDTCDAQFFSTFCNISCPVFNGTVCYGRGACFNGTCLSCMPLAVESTVTTIRCGASCELKDMQCFTPVNNCTAATAIGRWGPSCANYCPGATPTNLTNSCNARGICDTDTGRCYCKNGYFGTACQLSCPFGLLSNGSPVACSGHGLCTATGVCECTYGYYGVDCSMVCPGGAATPCSGKGQCNGAGLCVCRYGYFGADCSSQCPGPQDVPCSDHGVCSLTGECQCYSNATFGFWAGRNCSSCSALYGGPRCTVSCPLDRGVVQNAVCVCGEGFAGDDCSLQCPTGLSGQVGSGLVCAGHGTCTSVNYSGLIAAKCRCVHDYYGVRCDVYCTKALCRDREGLFRPQCNEESGACECETSPGIWDGPKCEYCNVSRWGAECNQQCDCNHNGVCDQTSGACHCFRDAANGYWKGLACTVCADGYVGSQCRTANVAFSSQSSNAVGILNEQHSNTSEYCSVLDVTQQVFWITGGPTKVAVLSLGNNQTLLANISLPEGTVTDCSLFDDQSVVIRARNGSQFISYRVSRTNFSVISHSISPLLATLWRGMEVEATAQAPPELVSVLSKNGLRCSLYGNATSRVVALGTCTFANGTSVSQNITVPIKLGWTILYFPSNPSTLVAEPVVVMLPSAGPAHILVWQLYPNSVVRVNVPLVSGRSIDRIFRCAQDLFSINNTAHCIASVVNAADPSFIDLHVVGLTVSSVKAAATFVTLIDQKIIAITQVSAVVVDEAYSLMIAAFNTPGGASTLVSFLTVPSDPTMNTVIGVQQLPSSTIAVGLDIIDASRTLLISAMRVFSLEIIRFSLFGVLAVSPSIVDASGGARVTISGVGFPLNWNTSVWCVTSGKATEATIVNKSTVSCAVSSTTSPQGACTVEFINVLIGQAATSTSTVGLLRPTSATLHTVTSLAKMTVGYGAAWIASTLHVTGFGFVFSTNAACRLVTNRLRLEIYRAPATVVNSSLVTCTQPTVAPSSEPTCVEYSHDGFYFGTSCASYIVVGDFGGIVAVTSVGAANSSSSRPTLNVGAALLTRLPSFFVQTQDAFGNPRSVYETNTELAIRCSSLNPDVAITNLIPETIPFTDNSSLIRLVQDGVASFTGLLIRAPIAASYGITCFPTVDSKVLTALVISISSGAPVYVLAPSFNSWKVTVRTKSVLRPDPVMYLQDGARNLITACPAQGTVAFLQNEILVDEQIGKFELQRLPAYCRSDGSFVFHDVFVRSVFDKQTSLQFVTDGVVPTSVDPPLETCMPATEYAVKGTTTCVKCPANSVCDGTSLVLGTNGYWRASSSTYEFFPCSPAVACAPLGCTVGYEGTKCAACSAGFGWSVDHCAECLPRGLNQLLCAMLFLGVVSVIYYLGIFTMPITSIVDTMYHYSSTSKKSSLSVCIKVTLSHLQILGLVPFAQIDMPTWMQSFFSFAQSGSSVNPNLSFISCVFGGDLFSSASLVVAACPVLFIVFALLSAAHARWVAYKFRRDAYTAVFIQESFTDERNIERVSEFIARGDPQYQYEVTKSHSQFLHAQGGVESFKDTPTPQATSIAPPAAPNVKYNFSQLSSNDDDPDEQGSDVDAGDGDSEQQEAIEEVREEAIALHTLQREKELINSSRKTLLNRWINVTCVSVLVTLFLLFPTILELCVALIKCESIDGGNGVTLTFVSRDPSISCTDASYTSAKSLGWSMLLLVGIGVPILNVVFVKVLTRYTCQGYRLIAQEIFFFSTGGYHRDVWFWESVSMFRKLLLVLGATLLDDLRQRVLWCAWLMIVSVMLNITMRPWSLKVLSNLELCSLAVLAASFGCVELLLFPLPQTAVAGSDVIVSFIVSINALLVVLLVFVAIKLLRADVEKLTNEGYGLQVITFAQKIAINNAKRNLQAARRSIFNAHERFFRVSQLENIVTSLIKECDARKLARPLVRAPRIVHGKVLLHEDQRTKLDIAPNLRARHNDEKIRDDIIQRLQQVRLSERSHSESKQTTPNPLDVIVVETLDDDVPPSTGNAKPTIAGADAFCLVVGEAMKSEDQQAISLKDALDEVHECWAYWSSLALANDSGKMDPIMTDVVEERLRELYAAEIAFLHSVRQLNSFLAQ